MTPSSVNVLWSAPVTKDCDIIEYEVEISKEHQSRPGKWVVVHSSKVVQPKGKTKTEEMVSGLESGTDYTVKVRTHVCDTFSPSKERLQSQWSDELRFSTPTSN